MMERIRVCLQVQSLEKGSGTTIAQRCVDAGCRAAERPGHESRFIPELSKGDAEDTARPGIANAQFILVLVADEQPWPMLCEDLGIAPLLNTPVR